MKKLALLLAMLACSVLLAQQDPPLPAQTYLDSIVSTTDEGDRENVEAPPLPPQGEEVFGLLTVEEQPEFPGGQEAMARFMVKNTKYPTEMIDANVQGRVYMEFVVRRDGRITDVEVKRGVARQLDEEAERVVKSMPNWKPAIMNGKPVACTMILPVKFTLK
ncbi:MAG: energy transducer TonB [Flavobacteriales bacterium]|nr:energy transducer TonB [Flavobacteriales bacterium]